MIYLALYRGKSLFPSQCIEWFTWSKYSHASIVYDFDGGRAIFEAWQSGGVQKSSRFRDLHTKGTRVDLYRFRDTLTATEETAILEAAIKELGRPYDWRGVFSFLLRRRMQKAGSWFCSELVSFCCRQSGRLLLACPDWQIAPGDIAKAPGLVFDSAEYA